MKYGFWIWVLGVLIGTSCTSSKPPLEKGLSREHRKATSSALSATAELGIADTLIQLFSRGGVTGLTSGCELRSDGRIRWFTKNLKGEMVQEKTTQIPGDSIRQALLELQNTGIFELSLQEIGNMTHFLVYRDPRRRFTLSWVADTELPPAFREWYHKYQLRCQEWQKSH